MLDRLSYTFNSLYTLINSAPCQTKFFLGPAGAMGTMSTLFLIHMHDVNQDRILHQSDSRNWQREFQEEATNTYNHEFRSKPADTQITQKT